MSPTHICLQSDFALCLFKKKKKKKGATKYDHHMVQYWFTKRSYSVKSDGRHTPVLTKWYTLTSTAIQAQLPNEKQAISILTSRSQVCKLSNRT